MDPNTSPTPTTLPIPNPAGQTPLPQQAIPPQFQPRPQSTPANLFQGLPGLNAQQALPGFQQALPGFHHIQQAQAQAMHQLQQLNANNPLAARLQEIQRERARLNQESGWLGGAPAGSIPGQQPFAGMNHLGPQQLPQRPAPGIPGTPGTPTSATTLQNLIAEQQRGRAAQGRQGVQDNGGNTTHAAFAPGSGRASPSAPPADQTTTYTRRGVGPNGESWQVTVNETTTHTTLPGNQQQLPQQQPPFHLLNPLLQPQMGPHHHPHHHHHHPPTSAGQQIDPVAEVQAAWRSADRIARLQASQNNQQRSASSPPAGLSSSTPFGRLTRPGTPATPVTVNSPSPSALLHGGQRFTAPPLNSQATPIVPPNPVNSNEPLVYILSSPSGPRALLMTGTETFFTPRVSRRHQSPAVGQIRAGRGVQFQNAAGVNTAPNQNQPVNPQNPAQNAANPQANPAEGGLGAQMGVHLWLIIRLIGFVWFFTSGNPSWTRWLMVSGLAFVVFIVNTGLFNGVFEQIWSPIRRHLENLLPLAGREAALVPAANAGVVPNIPPADNERGQRARGQGARRPGELVPEEVAARLMEQRRQADVGWVMAQVRRAEHAMLLFLASLVPGVGERHIAAREAEANAAAAERQRLIDEANAEAAAAEGESGEQAAADNEGDNAAEENRAQPEAQPPVPEPIGALPGPLVDVQ